ncbi:MAG: hypothetical protein ABI432_11575 [Flavobacteriales bacterium]
MRHPYAPTLLFIALPFMVQAQAPPLAWEDFFDGSMPGLDEARDVLVATDNSVYVTGAAMHMVPQGTITTLRYASDGTPIMADHVYGPSQETMNEGEALTMDAEGHVYVAGAFSANNGDMVLVKYGPNGRMWRENYEPYWFGSELDRALDVAVGPDGKACLAGSITSLSGMGLENFILKADTAGEQLWTDHSSLSSADEWATEVAVANDGTIYLAGHWWNTQSSSIDVSVAHYTPDGLRLWDRGFPAPSSNDRAMDIAMTTSGDVVVCGTAQGSDGQDLLVFARDTDGTLLWSHLIDGSGTGNDEAVAVLGLPDGTVAVAAHVVLQAGIENRHAVRVMVLEGDQVLWSEDYTGEAALGAWPTDLAVTLDGRLVISGYETAAGGTTTNGLLLSYTVGGELLWHAAYDAGAGQNDRFNAVAVNSAGDVVACGTAYTTTSASRYVTVQYGHAVGVAQYGARSTIQIQPSLATVEQTVLITAQHLMNATCNILDANGRSVLRSSFNGRLEWTPSTAGSYMVTVSQSGERYSALVVVR